MARPLRIEFPGALYHVTTRGNARGDIFVDDRDRHGFLAVLGQVVARWRWLCHAYCLMGNHYHLIVETRDANLARGMRQLNGLYTQRLNRRHGRVGHVFQGRYAAILVERDSHLLELARYVVRNPVRAGLVDRAEAWPWSSYRAMIGRGARPAWLHCDWLLRQFAGEPAQARLAYRAFVSEGPEGRDPWRDLAGQIYLGGAGFVRSMLARAGDGGERVEIPPRNARPWSSRSRLTPRRPGHGARRSRAPMPPAPIV